MMICERTHTRMTRRACLVRQGLISRAEERGPVRHVPIECRDCPQGKQIAQEDQQEKMAARQKSYEGPFACAKCGEGEEEGRAHGGRGLCTRCYAAETKKGTLSKWKLSPPIPKKDKSVTVASPVPAKAEVVLDSPIKAEIPATPAPPEPFTLTWESRRNRDLLEVLEMMAVCHRRSFPDEVFASLEQVAAAFLDLNPQLKSKEYANNYIKALQGD